MRTIRTGLAALPVLGLALAGCSDDGEANRGAIAAEDSVFNVSLTAGAEAPGPGSDGATGLAEITVNPDIYVNVHTQEFPEGAIRAQLT